MTEVEYARIPITSIIADPANYRIHTQAQINDLKASLKRFKQVEPAVVKRQGDQYVIVAHAGVHMAAKEMYVSDPLEYAHLYNYFVVIIPDDWSSEDMHGYMIASNETMRLGEVDDSKLLELLKEQETSNGGLYGTGISATAYAALMDMPVWSDEPPALPRSEPRVEKKKASKPQQIELLEQHERKPMVTTYRQLVLVMGQEAYETITRDFAILRDTQALGSNADVVSYLLDFYKQYHPLLLTEE